MVKKFNGFEVGEVWFDHAGNCCYYRDDGSLACDTVNNDSTLTNQSEKDSCDFGKIYAKYVKTGLMSNIRTDSPLYGDFSMVVDYHTAVQRSAEALDDFMRLPAPLRARFKNDPNDLISFLCDVNNRAEAIELGLIERPSVVIPNVSTPPEGGV